MSSRDEIRTQEMISPWSASRLQFNQERAWVSAYSPVRIDLDRLHSILCWDHPKQIKRWNCYAPVMEPFYAPVREEQAPLRSRWTLYYLIKTALLYFSLVGRSFVGLPIGRFATLHLLVASGLNKVVKGKDGKGSLRWALWWDSGKCHEGSSSTKERMT